MLNQQNTNIVGWGLDIGSKRSRLWHKKVWIQIIFNSRPHPGKLCFSLSRPLFQVCVHLFLIQWIVRILQIVKSTIDVKCFGRWTRLWYIIMAWIGSSNIRILIQFKRMKRFNSDQSASLVNFLPPRGFWPKPILSWLQNCICSSCWDIIYDLVLASFGREHNFPY